MATSRLSDSTLEHFATVLQRRREELLHLMHANDEALGQVRESLSEGTNDDEHDPEGPTMSDEWSKLTGLQAEGVTELRELDAALERISNHEFGMCASCGTAIGRPRLEARPYTTLCIDCARKAETH
ncbi:TraR/DksA family transcriptional regulator [Paramicrobacterium agarici]|uniref:TraR/DksA family transcriptional regulator n=1 Tax=Paramicrobacterium agarici TaxID=630514 RepID=A0A2A9DTL1_9MICO|nr:TraR/DksA C4-type zinc finger protein [Microbacterium agarici]PFG29696.1 TraR/DksA family transcriptional regulator [Microbacterium agarici]TQO22727.1 TraR/DksA family transcriptional regulator [Microbacterium agarici]